MEGILSHMEPGRGQWPGVEASGDQRQVCDNGSKNGREGTMAKSACMPRHMVDSAEGGVAVLPDAGQRAMPVKRSGPNCSLLDRGGYFSTVSRAGMFNPL